MWWNIHNMYVCASTSYGSLFLIFLFLFLAFFVTFQQFKLLINLISLIIKERGISKFSLTLYKGFLFSSFKLLNLLNNISPRMILFAFDAIHHKACQVMKCMHQNDLTSVGGVLAIVNTGDIRIKIDAIRWNSV